MDLIGIKQFLKPSWKKITLSLFYFVMFFLGSTAFISGGGLLTPAGAMMYLVMIGTFYLAEISTTLGMILILFNLFLTPYLVSCFTVFIYDIINNLEKKKFFKTLFIGLMILVLFLPLIISSSASGSCWSLFGPC